MNAGRFADAMAALTRLQEAGVTDLSEITSGIREDGLPMDWVADVVNLTQAQREEMAASIPGESQGWLASWRSVLVGG